VLHTLEGCNAKLRRARTHIRNLERIVDKPLKTLHEIENEFDPQSREGAVRFGRSLEPPLEWSVRIGEIAYHMRSCLDHLACRLIERSPGWNESYPRLAGFPVTCSRQHFDCHGKDMLHGASQEDVSTIESLQPYHCAYGHTKDPLWLLHEICGFDKHRALHLFFQTFDDATVRSEDGGFTYHMHKVLWSDTRKGTEIFPYKVKPGYGRPTFKVNSSKPMRIFFGKNCEKLDSPFKQDAISILKYIRIYIETHVLTAFNW